MSKEVEISLKLPKNLIDQFNRLLPSGMSCSDFFDVVIRDYISCHVKGCKETISIDEMLRRLIKRYSI